MPSQTTAKKAAKPLKTRSSRFGLRSSKEQETLLRRAAEASRKTLTEFILDSACAAAEQTLLDQRLFFLSGRQYQDLMDLLEAPARTNAGIRRLFSKPAPWDKR